MGGACVAAPIFGPGGGVVAAVSIAGPAARFTPDAIGRVGSSSRHASCRGLGRPVARWRTETIARTRKPMRVHMNEPPRILFAGLFHETHSFVPEPTTLADFTIRRGDEILTRRGDGSTIDGFLEVADEAGWDVIPVSDYAALPAGTVEHAVFEAFWRELDEAIRRELQGKGLDAIWLALHGAMVTSESEDPEGELLQRISADSRRGSTAAVRRIRSACQLHAADGRACQRARRLP